MVGGGKREMRRDNSGEDGAPPGSNQKDETRNID